MTKIKNAGRFPTVVKKSGSSVTDKVPTKIWQVAGGELEMKVIKLFLIDLSRI